MKYYVKFPLDAYALGPIEVENEKAIRKWIREFSGIKRITSKIQYWLA